MKRLQILSSKDKVMMMYIDCSKEGRPTKRGQADIQTILGCNEYSCYDVENLAMWDIEELIKILKNAELTIK